MEMIIIYFEIYAILAIALNLQLGITGLMNFAIGIFYGLGAYVFAMTSLYWNFNFFESLAAAILGNMIFSIPITIAAVRFKGEIFILITLAFQIVTLTIIGNLNLTGGQYGLTGIPQHTFFGFSNVLNEYMVTGAVLLLIVALFSYFLYRLPFTRVLKSIRDDAGVSATLGKNIVMFKMQSIALSCGIAAIAGALLVSAVPVLTPEMFDITISIDIILILVFGGLGNTRGAIIGAFFYHAIEHIFRQIEIGNWLNSILSRLNISMQSNSIEANLRVVLFCAALILVLYFRPQGISGKLKMSNDT